MAVIPVPGLCRPAMLKSRPRRAAAVLTVRAAPRRGGTGPHRGILSFSGSTWGCALGRSGITARKREGDGATPRAAMPLLALLWRADRIGRPATLLPARPARPGDGWCDAPQSGLYNRFVHLPVAFSHENVMRDDGLYDIVGIPDWNITRRGRGLGSAIFLHCAHGDPRQAGGLQPTAGCVALPRAVLQRLIARLPARAVLRVL
ncbi:L,D-transpeptidase family protein [Pseudoxanthobacter sp.]|uniref:L,D-transpeptidase family protein n=1 Tax=Pseudoxanthobacter sp. TaxID=1925742 RepID=UPI002FE1B3A7